MEIVRTSGGSGPYWRRVLQYCIAGGLQATLDEYVHILRESLSVAGLAPDTAAEAVSRTVCQVIGLRTSSMAADRIEVQPETEDLTDPEARMRSRFAMRFGDDRAEDGSTNRRSQVREAFNSPFWPFILATTKTSYS